MSSPRESLATRVLFIEDDLDHVLLIRSMFQEMGGFSLQTASCLVAAKQRLATDPFDVILLDLMLPDSGGLDTLREIMQSGRSTPVVVMSALSDEVLAHEAVRAGAQDYLVKGRVDCELLGRALRYAIERQRSEQALRTNERRTRALLDACPDMMFRLSKDGTFVDIKPSKEFTFLTTAEECLGRRHTEVLPPTLRESWDKHLKLAIQENATPSFQFQVETDGEQRHFEARMVACGHEEAVATIREVTESKKLAAQLQLTQRMEAVGRLAGGVAHDFNNILTVIAGNAELLLADVGGRDPLAEPLEEIREVSRRAARLTRQLLAFSRRQSLTPVPVDVNALVEGTKSMLQRMIGEDIELVTKLEPELRAIEADPSQIEQILMNLAVNARDAMPDGGTLVFETENADVREINIGAEIEIQPGPYVTLAVSDTGIGMDEATRSMIFEPFFTTKANGQGSGLGLSMVYGIVKQSNGYVEVESKPGIGTTFKILLPGREARTKSPNDDDQAPVETARGETVLVVEDDPNVLKIARTFLHAGGYEVLAAAGVDDAIKTVAENSGPIQLLATDVVLPGMSGSQLACKIRSMRPDVKVLYLSGYTEDVIAHHGVLGPGVAFLTKPYSCEELLRAVRETLDTVNVCS